MEADYGQDCELQALNDTESHQIKETRKGKNGEESRENLKWQESLKEAKTALRKFLETSTILGVGKVRDPVGTFIGKCTPMLRWQGSCFGHFWYYKG